MIDRLPALAAALRDIVALVQGIGGAVEPWDPIHLPEALEVPFDRIRDTYIEMARTPRERGDRLVLHGSLLKAGELIDESKPAFEIDTFGWSARLSTAVVLVRPDSLGGIDPNFGFAPSLSWMHTTTTTEDQSCSLVGSRRLCPTSRSLP